jgi:micrococcal nuclease
MRVLLILIAFAVLGCLAESPKLTPTSGTHPAITPTLSPTQIITPSPEFQFGVKYPAKAIHVYDGDTIKVNLSGQLLIIRLLGVDTPEKYPEKNKPYEYDAITNLTYLAEWGSKAEDFTYKMLYNKTVYIEFDDAAGLKGYYGRYLAYVYPGEWNRFQRLACEKWACKGLR